MDQLFALVGMAVLWLIYILPTIIACTRSHPNSASIAVLNILMGWTVVFWVGCLAWAVSSSAPRTLYQERPLDWSAAHARRQRPTRTAMGDTEFD